MAEQITRETVQTLIKEKFRNYTRFGIVARKSPDWVYSRLYSPDARALVELIALVETTENKPTSYELSPEDYRKIETALKHAVDQAETTLSVWCKDRKLEHWWVKKLIEKKDIRFKNNVRIKKLLRVLDLTL